MSKSSARQLELDYSSAFSKDDNARNDSQAITPILDTNASSSADIGFTLTQVNSAQAIASRMAGRLNAANISEREHKEWLSERQKLLDKKFDATITPRELNRLEYVRWSLDRIDDAKNGAALDAIEDKLSQYEQFLKDVEALYANLNRETKRPR